jgi:hypothetical protein
VVQIHPPQPTPLFGFNGLSQSHNWLGDSKPNFPAEISGFLYAQFYASSVFPCRLTHRRHLIALAMRDVWSGTFFGCGARLNPARACSELVEGAGSDAADATFVRSATNPVAYAFVVRGVVPAVTLFSSFIYAFGSFSVMVFFYVFHRAQQS